jgi:hypothetical protein
MKDYRSADTRYGFIFNGVHVERVSVEKGQTFIYISAASEDLMLRVTKGGRIRIQDYRRK